MSFDVIESLATGVLTGGLVSTVVSLMFLRRTTKIQEEIKSQFEQRLAVFESTRGWKERSVSELLGPVYMQLDRTQRAFDHWHEKNLYLEMKVIREGNLTIRDLLLTKANLIPQKLLDDAGQLILHYDRWLEEFERIRERDKPDLQTPFVFVGPQGYPFPRASADKFQAEFKTLWTELYSGETKTSTL